MEVRGRTQRVSRALVLGVQERRETHRVLYQPGIGNGTVSPAQSCVRGGRSGCRAIARTIALMKAPTGARSHVPPNGRSNLPCREIRGVRQSSGEPYLWEGSLVG